MRSTTKKISEAGFFTNLLKTTVKELPATFKYLDDVTRLMIPEIKSLATTTKPTVLQVTDGIAKRLYKDFFSSTSTLLRDVKRITFDGLTQKGITKQSS